MWVYKGESARQRSFLRPELGFWLDYWLFLHSEETHPVWCARPLGAREVAAALLATNPAERALIGQLRRELTAFRKLESYLHETPRLPALDSASAREVNEWCKSFLEIDKNRLIGEIVGALSNAVHSGSFAQTTFLTRRLASELGGDEWADRQLFIGTKQKFCDSGDFAERSLAPTTLADGLMELFTAPAPTNYSVELNLAPVAITKTIARLVNGPRKRLGLELICEEEGPPGTQGLNLKGIRCEVTAAHPELALSIALARARGTLDMLRLRHYTRTSIYGAAKVTTPAEAKHLFLSLPQPFWRGGDNRRAVPTLPKGFSKTARSLPEPERERWHAARWCLSNALAALAEDPHAAASQVWQALESYTTSGSHKPLENARALAGKYLARVPRELAYFFARQLSLQTYSLKNLGATNWYRWNSSNIGVEKWLSRVLDARSTHHFSTWSPPAPALIFNESLGLLPTISRMLYRPGSASWMEQRVLADLTLLYGLRNAVVHSGKRPLPRRMASYLAQLALEILFTDMKGRVADFSDLPNGERHDFEVGQADDDPPE